MQAERETICDSFVRSREEHKMTSKARPKFKRRTLEIMKFAKRVTAVKSPTVKRGDVIFPILNIKLIKILRF